MKKCPFCAEQILDSAIKCKHCGNDLNISDSKNSVPNYYTKSAWKMWRPVVYIVGILIMIATFFLWYIWLPIILAIILWKKTKYDDKKKLLFTVIIFVAFIALVSIINFIWPKPVITIIEPKDDFSVQAQTITIKGKVAPQNSEIKINNEKVNTENGSFTYEAQLADYPTLKNQIAVEATNSNGTSSTQVIVTRIFTDEERAESEAKIKAEAEAKKQEALTYLKNFKPNKDFQIFDSAITNKVTFDWDEFDMYHYYEAKKDEKILYVKVNTSLNSPVPLNAWFIDKDGKIVKSELSREYNFRKYQDYLRGIPGNDNDFEYREWVKFAYWTRIPAEFAKNTWYITIFAPKTLDEIQKFMILGKLN
ncbi:MAG: hypothetical protein NT116_05575 [Candidatus Parcubacteria bacterium]|nr:hypothetical protein [Candidatus Parcubacteria bacterium]